MEAKKPTIQPMISEVRRKMIGRSLSGFFARGRLPVLKFDIAEIHARCLRKRKPEIIGCAPTPHDFPFINPNSS